MSAPPATSVGVAGPFDGLSAPAEDGAVLVEPPMSAWPRLIAANRAKFPSYLRALGADASRAARVGVLAGHQPEFMHPGVWAKNVAAVRFAVSAGTSAGFLIVDSDTPHRIALRWPHREAGRWIERSEALAVLAPAVPFEHQVAHDTAAWRDALRHFDDVEVDSSAGLAAFVRGFLSGAAPLDAEASDYVRRWAAGIAALDVHVGVESPPMYRAAKLSAMPGADAVTWARFAQAVVARRREFAAAYNAALAEFRAVRGIAGTRHPVPNLAEDGARLELPFWLTRAGQLRRRAYAVQEAGCARLYADDALVSDCDALAEMSADERLGEWRVRPRALLLTMYTRMFLCDLFVHGLGGAKYDEITDGIIRRFWGVEPPAYACVTATLRLPLGLTPPTQAERLAALRRLRDVRWNPQRCCDGSRIVESLIEQRLRAAAESDRLRRDQPSQHAARRRVYEHIHSLNERILASRPELEPQARAAWAEIAERAASGRVTTSREWFYGLYPQHSLGVITNSVSQ